MNLRSMITTILVELIPRIAWPAAVRHDVHIDGTHYQSRQPGGLHPSYFSFSGTAKRTGKKSLSHEELLGALLQDVSDATTSMAEFLSSFDALVLKQLLHPKITPLTSTLRLVNYKKLLSELVEILLSGCKYLPRSLQCHILSGSTNAVPLKTSNHPHTSFYAAKRAKRIQAPPHSCPKVTLSKEARTALKFQRTEKLHQFKDALDAAWSQINDVTMSIASTHHKSFHHVQHDLYMGQGSLHSKRLKPNLWNTFCWKKSQDAKTENSSGHGKDTLQLLVHDNKAKYHTLLEQEQEALLKEYVDERQTRATGTRISTRSKVNDITQTLKAIENELNSLNCRTGTEVMLYMTHGSTDLPLRGIIFTTDGVQNFMGFVMGIDNQDLVSKMKGFSVQGVQGAIFLPSHTTLGSHFNFSY
ncbi:hypothetical protein EV424DRAFT_1533462 [Suillus variegatus]|nr:hypothetical protein EV424DRAFT_1533462 [Suillus variegatus]